MNCVQEHEFVDESVTKLLLAKEYQSGCLIPCSQAVFDFVVAAEMAFRTLQDKLLSSKGNVKRNVMSIIAEKTSDINFSTCHDVKNKLIKRYVNARLQFFAKKHSRIRKEKVTKSGHEMSSKSMQMRKSVSKLR